MYRVASSISSLHTRTNHLYGYRDHIRVVGPDAYLSYCWDSIRLIGKQKLVFGFKSLECFTQIRFRGSPSRTSSACFRLPLLYDTWAPLLQLCHNSASQPIGLESITSSEIVWTTLLFHYQFSMLGHPFVEKYNVSNHCIIPTTSTVENWMKLLNVPSFPSGEMICDKMALLVVGLETYNCLLTMKSIKFIDEGVRGRSRSSKLGLHDGSPSWPIMPILWTCSRNASITWLVVVNPKLITVFTFDMQLQWWSMRALHQCATELDITSPARPPPEPDPDPNTSRLLTVVILTLDRSPNDLQCGNVMTYRSIQTIYNSTLVFIYRSLELESLGLVRFRASTPSNIFQLTTIALTSPIHMYFACNAITSIVLSPMIWKRLGLPTASVLIHTNCFEGCHVSNQAFRVSCMTFVSKHPSFSTLRFHDATCMRGRLILFCFSSYQQITVDWASSAPLHQLGALPKLRPDFGKLGTKFSVDLPPFGSPEFSCIHANRFTSSCVLTLSHMLGWHAPQLYVVNIGPDAGCGDDDDSAVDRLSSKLVPTVTNTVAVSSIQLNSSKVRWIVLFDSRMINWNSGHPYHEVSFGGDHMACIDYDAMEAKSTSLPLIEDLIIVSRPLYLFFTMGSCNNLLISSGSELAMGHGRPFVSLPFNPTTWPYTPSVSFQSIESSQSLSDNASTLSSPTLPHGGYSFTSTPVNLVNVSSVVCRAQSTASFTDNRSAPSTPVHVHSSSTLNVQPHIPSTHAWKYYEFDSGTLTHCHTSLKSRYFHGLLPWLTQANNSWFLSLVQMFQRELPVSISASSFLHTTFRSNVLERVDIVIDHGSESRSILYSGWLQHGTTSISSSSCSLVRDTFSLPIMQLYLRLPNISIWSGSLLHTLFGCTFEPGANKVVASTIFIGCMWNQRELPYNTLFTSLTSVPFVLEEA
eukprot:scaffold26423_cov94-Cyclotella_meneghiniana.AAC.1